MLLKNAANWVNSTLKDESERGLAESELSQFEFCAFMCGSVNGYILILMLNGKTAATISSQRQDKRVFKNLDTIRNCLIGLGVYGFSVVN